MTVFILFLKGEKKVAEENILKTNETADVWGSVLNETEAKIAPEREYVRYIVPQNKEVILFFILVFLILFYD